MFSLILVLALQSSAHLPAQPEFGPIVVQPESCACLPAPILLLAPESVCPSVSRKPAAQDVAPRNVVLRWNETVLQAIRSDRTPPPLAARNLAIVHAAVYDAVAAIERTHMPYLVQAERPVESSLETAVAVAAHRSLVGLYPAQIQRFDEVLDQSLQAVPDGAAKDDSIRLGQYVAEKMLTWRERDGATASVRYTPRNGVGLWQPTPPNYSPALMPQWPAVICFCMRSGTQFRPAGPPAVGSADYWTSYREVKELGNARSSVRSADQTQIALFWADDSGTATPPGHWNQVAQAAARNSNLKTGENARLFALLNLALADAAIACWECKYHYQYWRPIEGIRSAETQAVPERSGDPQWTPLLTTPPFPSYSSGHSSFSGTAAAVLAGFFGRDDVRFTVGSDGLPGTTRSFTSFSAAAGEAGRSRIYGGIHWEFDNVSGLASGRALGEYVSRSYLLPRVP